MPRRFTAKDLRFKESILRLAELHAVRSQSELAWASKQRFLESKGYMLRSRFHPDWVPSWTLPGNEDMDPSSFEDYITIGVSPAIIDAIRLEDGQLVCLKIINTTIDDTQEVPIAAMFSRPPLKDDPRNHCVPIWDYFPDAEHPNACYIVMPFLRMVDEPPFETLGDVIDFVSQALEGLIFMHENGVAHRDCADANIMMDASNLFPQGFHPFQIYSDLSGQYYIQALSRKTATVKYYFTDFGLATYWPSDYNGPRLVTGVYGRDRNVPELSRTVPYDPFKVDIRTLGAAFRGLIYDKYQNVGFLYPLIQAMTKDTPWERPDAHEADRIWRDILATRTLYMPHLWRLRPRGEIWVVTVMESGINLADSAFRIGQGVVGWLSDLAS